jgi:biotin carboxylase
VPRFRALPLAQLGSANGDLHHRISDSGVGFPCVVKPLGLSGSRGVIRADNPAELGRAFSRIAALLRRKDIRAIRAGLEDEILIEDFIPGREYAIEGVVTDGQLQVFAVFDKPDPLDGPFFEETIYVTPSQMGEGEQRVVVEEVARGVRALGLRHGPVHAECRVGTQGVFLLEIAARPIGGLCSRVLRFDRERRSLEEVLLLHAVGEDVSSFTRETQAAGVMMIPIPRRGVYKSVRGNEDALRVPGVEDVRITAKPDQLLEPLPEAGSYLGFIFARGRTPMDVNGALREAHGRLAFTIDSAIDVRVAADQPD